MLLQANPFPECVCEATAILIVGYMFCSIIIMIFLLVLMIYLYTKTKEFLPILTLFLFSLLIGFTSMSINSIPFLPYFSIFFILFQSVLFI